MTDERSDVETSILTSSLRSDEPIRSSEQDRLSRARLVEVIARHILSTDVRESMVIGVNAPWGAGKVELTSFISGVGNTDKTAAALRTALDRGNARHLLERLMESVDRIPEEKLPSLVEVMLDFGDDLQFEQRGMYDATAELLPIHGAWRCLRRISPEEERHGVIQKSLKAGRSLFAVSNIASLADPERQSEALLCDGGLWESVKDTCVERVSGAAADASLWQRKGLWRILPLWMSWSDGDVRAVISRHVKSDENLLSFVGKRPAKPVSMKPAAADVQWAGV